MLYIWVVQNNSTAPLLKKLRCNRYFKQYGCNLDVIFVIFASKKKASNNNIFSISQP